MSNLERYLHDDPEPTPVLLKAAVAHAQFETIHPFLDGNGRVGRLLISLLLFSERVLTRPLLYLSLYLKQHRDAYYDHLQRVRTEGAWEAWLSFFLEGVIEVATSATETTKAIVQLSSATAGASTRSVGVRQRLTVSTTLQRVAWSCEPPPRRRRSA
jgi:Fic family protein